VIQSTIKLSFSRESVQAEGEFFLIAVTAGGLAMKRKRFSEGQIIGILNEAAAGCGGGQGVPPAGHQRDHPLPAGGQTALEAIDRHVARTGGRTDLGEIAQLAAAESLSSVVGRDLPGLFGTTPDDVKLAVGRFSGKGRFADLARDFSRA
jgi:hypothetical protein